MAIARAVKRAKSARVGTIMGAFGNGAAALIQSLPTVTSFFTRSAEARIERALDRRKSCAPVVVKATTPLANSL